MPEYYDRRMVYAPEWMKTFACTAGDCPETCCQQWNVDVDAAHAERFRHLDDPEMQEIMDRILRTFRLRRSRTGQAQTWHRLQLLDQPGRRCPFLNERDECRMQLKYGAYILCDTCYFYPRTFWQIDEQTYLSACLSCSECARLALLHPEPTAFSRFEVEIDPNTEWLETELIADTSLRGLLRKRDQLIETVCGLLQDRKMPLKQRICQVFQFLKEAETGFDGTDGSIGAAALKAADAVLPPVTQTDHSPVMRMFAEVFDPVSDALEKPAQGAASLFRKLAGGTAGYAAVLAENFRSGLALYEPFIERHAYLEENFLVHYVFSDSLKQFSSYQNDPVRPAEILSHEARLLFAWYWFLRVIMSRAALEHGEMNEDLFLQTVIRADKVWWHYPGWFARCADRMRNFSPEDFALILNLS